MIDFNILFDYVYESGISKEEKMSRIEFILGHGCFQTPATEDGVEKQLLWSRWNLLQEGVKPSPLEFLLPRELKEWSPLPKPSEAEGD